MCGYESRAAASRENVTDRKVNHREDELITFSNAETKCVHSHLLLAVVDRQLSAWLLVCQSLYSRWKERSLTACPLQAIQFVSVWISKIGNKVYVDSHDPRGSHKLQDHSEIGMCMK